MSNKEILHDDYRFVGHMRPPVVASPDGSPWRSAITGAAPPTVATANLGFMNLALTATNEAQNACLYFGDVLSYPIDKLVSVDIWAKLTDTFAAANTVSFGVASARNDTPESMTALALFKCVGNNNVVLSTDDNVNDISDIAAGLTLGAGLVRRFNIDFASGIKTVVGGLSKGGKAAVQFNMDNDRGQLTPVGRLQAFDLSNYALGLQPFLQIQKTVGVTTGTLSVQRVRIGYKQN